MTKNSPEPASARSSAPDPDPLGKTIVGVLAGLLVVPGLALGAIAPWARLSLFLVAVVLFALWVLQAAQAGTLRVRRDPLWLFLLAFWGVLLLQTLPLPGAAAAKYSGIAILGSLDNATLAAAGDRTLSISPYDTRMSMLRFAAFTLIFFVAVNTIRRRGEMKFLLFTLIAAGTVETLFGFSGYFSGQRYPSWAAETSPFRGVMGTFPHKNYFSGFLEMTVPVALGFLVFLGRERQDSRGTEPGRTLARRFLSTLARPVFSQQVILSVGVVVMISGIAFSLCRAGVFVLIVTLAAFLVLLGLSRRSRPYVLVILVLGGIAAGAGLAIGLDKVVGAVEDAGSRHSSSWLHRWDMTRNALGIARDFPLFGTGLGTTEQVFTRYQSSQHADLRVRYLHNDALQLLCETGSVGWLTLVAGGALFLARAAIGLHRRRDLFAKWVGTGALLGVGAMLLHSLFEHNLGKVTSNGVVFTVLLAVAGVCSRGRRTKGPEEGQGFHQFDVSPPALRAALVAGSICACVLAFAWVIPLIRAELALNRHVSGSGRADPYFFLPVAGQGGDGAAGPRIALALAPTNHRYQYAAAVQGLGRAEEAVRRGAVALLGLEREPRDDEDMDRILQVLLKNLPPGLAAARNSELAAARAHLDAAVRLAPAMADYHFLRGLLLYELEGATPEAFREADAAVRMAPKVPGILFGVGNLLLDAGWRKTGPERDLLWGRARVLLRASLLVDPSYATRAYPAVLRAFGVQGLIDVTPPTISASEKLYTVLWREKRWEEALSLLDDMERLASTRFKDERELAADDEDAAPAPAADENDVARIGWAYDQRPEEALRRSLAQRRASLLGILGRWPERRTAVFRYRSLLREDSSRQMQEVGSLRRQGRNGEALRRCLTILEQDWSCAAALLEAAELATLPGVRAEDAPWNSALDHLYRLVAYNEELTADDVRRLGVILDRQVPGDPPEEARKTFLRGAAEVLGGRPEKGAQILEQLAVETGADERPWGQGHLLWYYVGQGREKAGQRAAAAGSYLKALSLVPDHLPSLRRLAALQPDAAARLARLEPGVKLDVPFGGRITLLGYSVERPPPGSRGGEAAIQFFWQFAERTETRYRPAIRIGGFDGNPVFANRNAIFRGSAPYPIDTPRSGEVVTESYPLAPDLLSGAYLKVALMVLGSPQSLYHDLGGGFVTLALK